MKARYFQSLQIPELIELEDLIRNNSDYLEADIVTRIRVSEQIILPVYCLRLGSTAEDCPKIGFFGGFHGLERIGIQILLVLISSLLERMRWDVSLNDRLSRIQLIFMPLVNPGGLWNHTRSNPNGIDLMRNSPVIAHENVPWLAGGHHVSRRLPWFRGESSMMEPEAQAVCDVVEKYLFAAPFSFSLDCHSGFGFRDRVWFPYAKTKEPFYHLPEMLALKQLFNRSYPYHKNYLMEPQSRSYTTHGDIWDHLYDQSLKQGNRTFLPLTLEMGSWAWIRSNPLQLFWLSGLFNPLLNHRKNATLRQHLILMEFLINAACSWTYWMPHSDAREALERDALKLWYYR
ncbi:MAG: zinc carboxypeptidase [SAR324 cluster bacterium]|nr:zinc carboxypeptidase [SAR324 cluster bacterium]